MKKDKIVKLDFNQVKKLSREEMKLILAGSDKCSNASGRATTSRTCASGIDKEASIVDTTLCCISV